MRLLRKKNEVSLACVADGRRGENKRQYPSQVEHQVKVHGKKKTEVSRLGRLELDK